MGSNTDSDFPMWDIVSSDHRQNILSPVHRSYATGRFRMLIRNFYYVISDSSTLFGGEFFFFALLSGDLLFF